MIKHLLVILAIAIMITGCTQKGDVVTNLGDNFTLSPGHAASIPSEGLTFKFISVVEDSRCPQGVQCFWAGQTTIAAEAEKGNIKSSFNITKKAGAEPGIYESMGYRFQFVDIGPARVAGQNISEANVTFVIMKN